MTEKSDNKCNAQWREKFLYSQEAAFEILESRYPSREELLAQLGEIEEFNNFIKAHGLQSKTTQAVVGEALIETEDTIAGFNDSPDVFFESSPPVLPDYFSQKQIAAVPDPFAGWRPRSLNTGLAHVKPRKNFLQSTSAFFAAGALIFLVIFSLSVAGRGIAAKQNILSSAMEAYRAMLEAKDSAARFDFSVAAVSFDSAYNNFLQADGELNKMGRLLISVLEKMPGGSVISSGSALVKTGEDLARAGNSFSKIGDIFLPKSIGAAFSVEARQTLAQKISEASGELRAAQEALESANRNLAQVSLADLPADFVEPVSALKEKLPAIASAARGLNNWSSAFLEVLGQRKAKKYLLIFQNPGEARPTGGFIGTYGILDLDHGRIKKLFIDGIFNLDGQLNEKIIPPRPIQKISTAWSTHDANWFADFPASARKIMLFYEKAGGETVDGVISLTPQVIVKLLAVTGPVDLPQYGVSLDSGNFLDAVQYKIEADYDKAQNQPKKILADFAPVFLDRLALRAPQSYKEIFEILGDSLAAKDILFYFSDDSWQEMFSEQGWSGEILPTDKDFLAVINTNINGFKTDRVIEQKISHEARVGPDGAIVDTVRVLRQHRGGSSQYDWYNKVNADYLRVYVPKGSRLLSAKGQTREAYKALVDYQALNFKTDPEVAALEQNMVVDEDSGTEIFEESGKTVFGNWIYVSPGETVELIYQYVLPFKLNFAADNASYSLLAQKQAGSSASALESVLRLPETAKINWQYPENLQSAGGEIRFNGALDADKFYGVVISLNK